MRRLRVVLIVSMTGLAGLAGCRSPYKPTSYNGDMPPMGYGMPMTEGPMLNQGGTYPYPPGTVVVPGNGMPPGSIPGPIPPQMPPGSIPAPNPPYIPPATGAAPPLNNPPPTGPMPRIAPTSPTKS